jgi:class 3 adenylate cyclase
VHDAPETRYARDGDVRIAYQAFGDGPIDLLFAIGGMIPVDVGWEDPGFARFMRRLATFSRVVIFDSRGWGASRTAVDTLPTVEEWADDLRLVLDSVGSERAAIVGHYAGAAMSTFFAAAHPDRVSSLVLIEASARMLRAPDYPIGLPAASRDRLIDGFVENFGTGADLKAQASSREHDESFRRWWGRCERLANGPHGAGAYWRALSGRDLRAVLPALRVPTLVLHRSGDPFIRADHGRYLAEHIPGARYVELDGVDNLPSAGDSAALLGEIEEFLTGGRRRIAERELLTLLFSDIVGSTGHAARLGDAAWRDLLVGHDAVVRRELDRFGGREVKTVGDAFLVSFERAPSRAVRCAQAIVAGLEPLGLTVRIGLHTGECEVLGDDVGGMAVHIAARVAALAAPGEVLASGTVYGTVVGAGVRFKDRGTHQLRDVPGRWPLFGVI